jgi:hypothetical protein
MSEQEDTKALVPTAEEYVDFYGDELVAVQVEGKCMCRLASSASTWGCRGRGSGSGSDVTRCSRKRWFPYVLHMGKVCVGRARCSACR